VRGPGVDTDQRAVLYLHGGAYFSCGLRTHRRMVAQISAAAGAPALSVGYRMCPRWTLADAVADGVSGYRYLLDQGFAAHQIVIAGDSAGGGLSFLVAAAVRDQGMPRPGGIATLSPWTDLDSSMRSAHANANTDPLFDLRTVRLFAEHIVCRGEIQHAFSPVNLDLLGLPPTLIHVGDLEMLQADAETMAERLAAAGVAVRLKHWQGQIHVFQAVADFVPEGRQAIREIGDFVRQSTAG
jgi:acetyl esterase/lipase